MYDYFNGYLTDKRKTSRGAFFTVEVSDTGFLLEVTERDFVSCDINENNKRKFYTSLIHREDAMVLYGFLNKETRDIFQILLSVSGVGAKMALALLNEFDDCDLISFVIDGNFKELTRAKGVGPKLAQKIILELKDKLMKTELPQRKTSSSFVPNQAVADVQTVMLSLGYDNDEIESALANVMSTIEDSSNTEEILRKALTSISM
jgi:Holliday junction DNA helicase RuvA